MVGRLRSLVHYLHLLPEKTKLPFSRARWWSTPGKEARSSPEPPCPCSQAHSSLSVGPAAQVPLLASGAITPSTAATPGAWLCTENLFLYTRHLPCWIAYLATQPDDTGHTPQTTLLCIRVLTNTPWDHSMPMQCLCPSFPLLTGAASMFLAQLLLPSLRRSCKPSLSLPSSSLPHFQGFYPISLIPQVCSQD